MYVISDNVDTYVGMRLAGVDGIVIHDKETLEKTFDDILKNKTVGIVLITEKLANDYKDYITKIRLAHKEPLIVEIPDRHGSKKPSDYITSYVNEAIGLKL